MPLQGNKSKVAIGSGVIASALLIAIPFIHDKEGDSLESYQDVVGVWTICGGVTGVEQGVKLTQKQCKELTDSTIGKFMNQVASRITVPVTPQTLAAHTSFAYNIGIGGYSDSKALKLTNAGDIPGGCWAMRNWYTAGGRDCRIRQNGCYGIVQRRNAEVKLCLGAQ